MRQYKAYPCELCGEIIRNKQTHRKVCKYRLSLRTKNGGHKCSDETKRKISVARKKFLRKNPDKHPWKNNTKFVSVPCEFLKKRLQESDIIFFSEFTDISWDKNFSIDIAFPDKKVGIEVNGNQHYNRDGTLKTYYQQRHDWFTSAGWTIIEMPYNYVFDSGVIQIIKKSLEDNKSKYTFTPKIRANKKKEHEKRLAYAKEHGLIRKNGVISGNGISNEIYQMWKEKIINSGVDITRFGWVQKVSNLTGISLRHIHRTVDKFPDAFSCVFRRKSPSLKIG